MKDFLKILVIATLAFIGSSALVDGWNLVTHPEGRTLNLSLRMLAYSPFSSYRIPGLALFALIGTGSLVAALGVILNLRYQKWLVITEGILLAGWIVLEILIIRTVVIMQSIVALAALLLILIGLLAYRGEEGIQLPRSNR